MGKLEPYDGKRSRWQGLWWHPEYNGFSSEAFSLADLRKYKGQVRLYVRKNRFFNNGENGRPNYNFSIVDAKSDRFNLLEVEEDARATLDAGGENGRVYTEAEVRRIIHDVGMDVQAGINPYDLLPSDYV